MSDDLAALMAAAGRPMGPDERLAIAVSGGPDSIGLLAMAAAAFSGRVTALSVDHGLRAGSAAEVAGVAAQCAARGLAHETLVWTGDKPGANLQAAARAARYALMLGWCRRAGVPLLLTAHHADDQAETLLMRLARGSGSGGLAGVRARREADGVEIVRPLLGLRRAAISRWAEGWETVSDPSNADPRFDRTAVRGLLARAPGLLPAGALAASAAHLADEAAALDWTVAQAWAGRAEPGADGVWLDADGLPGALRRRLLARAVLALVPAAELRGAGLDRLLARLDSGRAGTLAGVRAAPAGGLKGGWALRLAPKRRG